MRVLPKQFDEFNPVVVAVSLTWTNGALFALAQFRSKHLLWSWPFIATFTILLLIGLLLVIRQWQLFRDRPKKE